MSLRLYNQGKLKYSSYVCCLKKKIMILKSIITLVIISSLFAFISLYLYFYEEYDVYAFPPSNAPAANQTIKETITTTNTSNTSKQQQSSNNKDSSEIDNKTTYADKNITEYHFVFSWRSWGDKDNQRIYRPDGIAIDSSDNVYVADFND